ncbi:hypothetical protein Lalb_Chr19g0127491 [Lupinus albus]|uniref:Uncharacterized protein n=1 Tax=Lupinus albus TaxID=3870 RepID=A0A6A4NF10_LUPAL|nr:hypothetical protein Lalb_Chr19g0127491 [Lupinus albus]
MATTTTTLFLSNPFKSQFPIITTRYSHPNFTYSSVTAQSHSAKHHLLTLISDEDRGIKTQTNPQKRASIVDAIDAIAAVGVGSITTG